MEEDGINDDSADDQTAESDHNEGKEESDSNWCKGITLMILVENKKDVITMAMKQENMWW